MKTRDKAPFENIIRSAAARIAATTLRVFESLRFEKTDSNLNYEGKLSCHDPAGMFSGNERKRDNVHVGCERSYMQFSSNSV